MNKYSGLMIDGPMSGKMYVGHNSTIRMELPPPAVLYPARRPLKPGQPIPNIKVQTIVYRFVSIAGCGFWIPTDKGEVWLLEQLAKAYIEMETNSVR